MASSAKPIAVVVALLIRDGKLLVAQRNRGRFAGLWEFPGGKIEPNETAERALVRELKEEINVDVQASQLQHQYVYDYGDYAVDLQVFLVTDFHKEPEGAEGQVVQWVDLPAFEELEVLEATHKIKPLIVKLLSC